MPSSWAISTLLAPVSSQVSYPLLSRAKDDQRSSNSGRGKCHEGMFPLQRAKAATHIVALLSFMQGRTSRRDLLLFPTNLRREDFRWADLVQRT
jgi:hypothetical protein